MVMRIPLSLPKRRVSDSGNSSPVMVGNRARIGHDLGPVARAKILSPSRRIPMPGAEAECGERWYCPTYESQMLLLIFVSLGRLSDCHSHSSKRAPRLPTSSLPAEEEHKITAPRRRFSSKPANALYPSVSPPCRTNFLPCGSETTN